MFNSAKFGFGAPAPKPQDPATEIARLLNQHTSHWMQLGAPLPPVPPLAAPPPPHAGNRRALVCRRLLSLPLKRRPAPAPLQSVPQRRTSRR